MPQPVLRKAATTIGKVYVDEPIWPFGRMMMCHMVADRLEDLHAMADKIGVARKWFQNNRYPHYDISKSKRELAVRWGAVEIDKYQFVAKAKALIDARAAKTKHTLPVPVSVYTDGSASFKAGNGGWGFVVLKGEHYAEVYGWKDPSSVGEMELTAIHEALRWLPFGPSPIRLFSDSQYAVNVINVWAAQWEAEGWYGKHATTRKHIPLIKSIMAVVAEHRKHRAVTVAWIPGHRKHPHNEKADKLAGKARRERITNL